MPIGNNVSQLLKARHEKIRPFSRKIGISYTTAFDLYHANTTAISFGLLDKLCNYFGATPNELFPYIAVMPDSEDIGLSESAKVLSEQTEVSATL
jgi:DNA-binding Xre family transcriptional regulator